MADLRLDNPWALLLLLAIPWFVYVYIKRGFGAGGALRFSDLSRMRRLPVTLGMRLRHGLFVLRILALILLVLALARPQASFVIATQYSDGHDIVLVTDLSTSMLAEDLRPGTSRLEVAKEVAKSFVEQRPHDNFGLVTFAMYATMRCPLTLHHPLLQAQIDRLRTSRLIFTHGRGITAEEPDFNATAIGSGLGTAVRMLRESEAEGKIVVLLTDGENNVGIHPYDAAHAAHALGVRVYTIGVGVRGNAPIPIYDPHYGKTYREMPTDIDDASLMRVAEITGGRYFRAEDAAALREIFHEIDQLEKTEITDESIIEYQERFTWLVLLALGLIFTEQLLAHTRFRTLP